MEQRFATILSRIFNPFMIVVLFLATILNLRFYFVTSIPENARWMILGLATITTLIIPGLLSNVLQVLLKRKMNFKGRDVRLLPLAIGAAFYLFTYHLFDRIHLPPVFNHFILGMASLAVISMVVNLFKNMSLFMVGTGALLGGIAGIHLTQHVNLMLFIIIALIIGGLTGYARLTLGKHKPAEIYTGYFAGAAIMLAHYLFL